MEMSKLWLDLCSQLKPGMTIRNWTAAKDYFGDDFKIFSVSSSGIQVDPLGDASIQYARKIDFKLFLLNWDAYCNGTLARKAVGKDSNGREIRVSKYVISMIKHARN
jgi:hypothetical protein